jgi:tRNA(Ile)-lysidine synthase
MTGSKKVSDYLVDAKVSLPEKGRQFVLVNGEGEIVWLTGRRLDDRYKITEKTENVLKITREVI